MNSGHPSEPGASLLSARPVVRHELPPTPYRSCGLCGYVEGCAKCKQEGHWCLRMGDKPVWNKHE